MSPRGYRRYYPKEADAFAPLAEVRNALDPESGIALPHLYLDALAQAMPWRPIDPRSCQPELAHALALDHEAGPARLKAIIYRAYRAGDAFADAMAQDQDDEAFARWATDRPDRVKEATLATLLDDLVGGGEGMGGSDYQPNHVRLFTKYCDGGHPWEAFRRHEGLLRRAIGVIDRDVAGDTLDADDLFDRATEAIRCLDEIRDRLLYKRTPQRFRLAHSGRCLPDDPIRSAIGAFCRMHPAGTLSWSGAPAELHERLRWFEGVQADVKDFLDALDRVGDQDQALAQIHDVAFVKQKIVTLRAIGADLTRPSLLDGEENSAGFALAAFFHKFVEWKPGAILSPVRVALEWSGSVYHLLEQIEKFHGNRASHRDCLGIIESDLDCILGRCNIKRSTHITLLWPIHPDLKREIITPGKSNELPRFFFVARLAEVYAISTGEAPSFSDIKAQGHYGTPDERWSNLFHSTLSMTGLGGTASAPRGRPGLLDRLAGRRDYAPEGAENASRLEALARMQVGASPKIGWYDGFLTDWMVAFAQRFPAPPMSA